MKRLNKNIGARVEVRKVLIKINPIDGWVELKKVKGTIVENTGYKRYYHYANGTRNRITKVVYEFDGQPTYAIQLDNNIKDIEGNNVVVYVESDLKFLDRIDVEPKPVTEKQYLYAKDVIKRYESENNL
jgi:hypothetical protein